MTDQTKLTRISEDTLRLTLPPEKPAQYDIVIGCSLFPRIARDLKDEKPASRYVIITDSNVKDKGYSEKLERELQSAGLRVQTFDFPAGEQSKNRYVETEILEKLGEAGCNRDTMILALGGGVVGDMAGDIAASFLRGIPFIDIPTTTLSQADSAIGGKKGVDLKAGKNLAGTFAQAWRVYMDLFTLHTLDNNNFRAGLVEGIKHGVIADAEHFEYFEKHLDDILLRDYRDIRVITERNCDIKGRVVQIDPKEKGLRRILNYGHTLGHAIEKASDYRLLHGQAVAKGMHFAARLASKVAGFKEEARQASLLRRLGMNLEIPAEITNAQLFALMGIDKKAEAGQIRFCLPYAMGQMMEYDGRYSVPVEKSLVEAVLDSCRNP